jgi:hypothetical protein
VTKQVADDLSVDTHEVLPGTVMEIMQCQSFMNSNTVVGESKGSTTMTMQSLPLDTIQLHPSSPTSLQSFYPLLRIPLFLKIFLY